jgi:aspartate/methionine/tyrosine aminotransferase
MNNLLAERVSSLKPSATVALPDKARALRQSGIDVLDLAEGDPYFDTPKKIKTAAIEALDQGFVHYISSAGLKELREAIAEKLRIENGIDVKDSEVIVTVGAKQALFMTFLSVVNPGDEVLMTDPGWVSYSAGVTLASGKPIPIRLLENKGFGLNEEEIKEKITKRTKAIVLNSPHNPTGTVFPKDELSMIADIAQDHNLLIISDEIYEKIIYDDAQHHSIASFPGMKDQTITINGFSKAFSMTGWRLGYVAAEKEIIDNMLKVQQHSVTQPCSFVEKAGIVALKQCREEVESMVKVLKASRDFFVEGVNKSKIFQCSVPKGAFYVFPKIIERDMSSEGVAEFLLKEANVLVVPGTAFGDLGEGYIRLVYSRPMEELETAIQRIHEASERLQA